MGTKFTVYDHGVNPVKAQSLVEKAHTRQELAAICYVSTASPFLPLSLCLVTEETQFAKSCYCQPPPLWNQVTNFNQIQQRAETPQINSYQFNEKKRRKKKINARSGRNTQTNILWPFYLVIQCVARQHILYMEPATAWTASGLAGVW